MKKIGIDVDDVLRDTMERMDIIFKTYYPDKIIGDTCYAFDFPHINLPYKEKMDIMFRKYPKEIFFKAKPCDGVIENFNILKLWLLKKGIKMVCVTSQEQHLINLTYLWLGKYNIVFDELHISKNKGGIGLDYLVDDAPHNYTNWIDNNNKEENFILMDKPWNQNTTSTNRIQHFLQIKDIIEKIDGKNKRNNR